MIKFELEIKQDNNPENPREWDNLGTMICFHRRYSLGDKHDYNTQEYDGWKEMEEAIIENENVHTILPLYLYDHSGITISTTPFSCHWDSGKIGFIYVSKDKVLREGIDETKIEEYLKNEVETYDKYLTGDVWGYDVYRIETCDKGHDHRTLVESCYGFYDEDECRSEGEKVKEYQSITEDIAIRG